MILRISAIAATLALCASTLALAADAKATYQLSAQNGSGETGTIVLTPTADGKGTVVTVTTKGQGADPQPIHVHKGPCAKLEPKPTYPLKTLQDGKSETTLAEVPMSTLLDGDWAINVHKSTTEAAIYVACSDLTKPKVGAAGGYSSM
jgi:hypothetical protein